jgi:hypothetical protein
MDRGAPNLTRLPVWNCEPASVLLGTQSSPDRRQVIGSDTHRFRGGYFAPALRRHTASGIQA